MRPATVEFSKVPEVTIVFWIIKIAATTLGETGGDTITMTLNWGYLAGTALFLGLLLALVVAQIRAKKFRPFLYWATIVASTTFGTTMADFADRSLGIGYTGGSSLLFACLIVVLALWYRSQGTIAVNTVATPKVEGFYWAAITFSQTLGTALGDWAADTGGLGYEGGALVFAAGLAVVAWLYLQTSISRVLLFWAAFILSRPLGATAGDFLDKPVSDGGLALSRPLASAVITVFILIALFVLPQRAGQHPEAQDAATSGDFLDSGALHLGTRAIAMLSHPALYLPGGSGRCPLRRTTATPSDISSIATPARGAAMWWRSMIPGAA